MIDIALLAGVAIVISSVLLVFGCVCHLFKRGSGFTTFENDLEGGFGNTVFSQGDTSDISQVTFETIPDILAKTVTATALRPRISCTNTEIQKQSAKRVASFKAFPRSHLTYIKEMGVGWFGQVLVSEAYNMVTSSRSTRVVVKMMKDDANSTEQQLFLQDLSVYREMDHPNVLKLLGQCTEASPFLTIVEYASMGDLKSYLRKERQIVKTMKDGIVRMQFLTDMASGLQCLHVNGYLHHDFACRNCVVMSNMTVKIGDYGVAEDHFREDYYDNGQDLLPIRWMAPESISLTNSIWQVTEFTKQSNMWSFGVAMFEVTEYGHQPYKDLTDEMVLQNMIKAYPTCIELPHTDDPIKSQLYQMMQLCWQDSSHRPQIEEIHAQLQKIQSEKEAADEAEFERKWAKMSTREARVVKVEVHASDISGIKHNVVDDICAADFNSNSLPTHINADEKGDNFNCEIVSGSIGHDSPISTPNRPTVHRSTSTPVGSNKDSNKVSNSQPSTPLSSVKDTNKVSNSQPSTPLSSVKDTNKVSNSQPSTPLSSVKDTNKVSNSQPSTPLSSVKDTNKVSNSQPSTPLSSVKDTNKVSNSQPSTPLSSVKDTNKVSNSQPSTPLSSVKDTNKVSNSQPSTPLSSVKDTNKVSNSQPSTPLSSVKDTNKVSNSQPSTPLSSVKDTNKVSNSQPSTPLSSVKDTNKVSNSQPSTPLSSVKDTNKVSNSQPSTPLSSVKDTNKVSNSQPSTPLSSVKDTNKVSNSQPSTPLSSVKDTNKVSNSQPSTPLSSVKDTNKVSNSQPSTPLSSVKDMNKVTRSQPSTPLSSVKDMNKVTRSQPSTPQVSDKDKNKVTNSQPTTPQVFAKDENKDSNSFSQKNTDKSTYDRNKVGNSQSTTGEDKSSISAQTLTNKDQTDIKLPKATNNDQVISSTDKDPVKLNNSIPDICLNGTKIENDPCSYSSFCETQLDLTVDKKSKESQSVIPGGADRNEEKKHKNENSVSFVNNEVTNSQDPSGQFNSVDSIIDFEEKYGETPNSVHKQEMLDNLPKTDNVEDIHSETNSKTDNIDDLSDENEEDEAEKLRLLKLTLSGVLLSTDVKSSVDENSGISSPTSDDMDIAREIYISKGMSAPPSKYTSTRSLNTILEDELLCEEEPQTKASELKFVEPSEEYNMSDPFIDSFEWDDYIGDELVGRVRSSDISPRESIDFPDWTMEQDSSSQDSEIHNDSKNEANRSGKSGRKINTSNLSDSEVKNSPLGALASTKSPKSPLGALASTKSPKSPLGAAAHSYVKHILSNRSSNTNKNVSFYSFSHNTDQDQEHGTSTTPLYNPMDEWEI